MPGQPARFERASLHWGQPFDGWFKRSTRISRALQASFIVWLKPDEKPAESGSNDCRCCNQPSNGWPENIEGRWLDLNWPKSNEKMNRAVHLFRWHRPAIKPLASKDKKSINRPAAKNQAEQWLRQLPQFPKSGLSAVNFYSWFTLIIDNWISTQFFKFLTVFFRTPTRKLQRYLKLAIRTFSLFRSVSPSVIPFIFSPPHSSIYLPGFRARVPCGNWKINRCDRLCRARNHRYFFRLSLSQAFD